MRILFLLPTLGHPRHIKRIRSLRGLGVDAKVMAFSRQGALGIDDESVEVLGEVRHEDARQRLAVYARAMPAIRRELRSADVVYCFGPDLLGLARAAGLSTRRAPRIVVEMGDLPFELVRKDRRGAASRALERLLLQGDVLLVATSPAFVENYYRGIQGLHSLRCFVLENKVDPAVTPPPLARRLRQGPLRIGWFGLLRCEDSWSVLHDLVQAAPDRFRVEIRGLIDPSLGELSRRVLATDGLTHYGRYQVPDDLPGMFDEIDLCWMVHHDPLRPYETWGWARSNRLYQAGWYKTPIIGQYDKDDSRVVEELDCGMTLDVTRPQEAIEKLLAISDADLTRWRANLDEAPTERFALSGEHASLLRQLGGSGG